MQWTTREWCRAGAVIALALSGAACDSPGTFVVGTTSDSGDDSLRAAIAWANASSERNVRIELPQGEYELTSCGSDDTNARGDLDLTTERSVTIVATAPGVVIRQTCSGERVLHSLGSGLLTLSRVQLSGGSVVGSDPAKPAQGGGLRARGSVRLEQVTIAENSVTGAPGQSAPAGQAPITGGLAQGGGVFVEGSLYAASTTFSSNTARGGAGTDAPSNDGVASGGGAAEGGAAYVAGIVNIEAGMLTQNGAVGGDGGRGPANPGGGGAARGGAVAQSAAVTLPVTLANVTLSANSALGGASGYGTGPSFPPESVPPAAGAASGGALACAGPFNATAIDASQNTAHGGSSGLGGCPADTQCLSSAEPGAARGGAIAAGRATVRDGTFAANRAASGNVGCSGRNCSAFGAPAEGGGVWSASELSLTDVAFTDNDASQGTGIAPSYGAGGALGGGAASAGALAVEGATFSGNAATQGRGGALGGSSVTVRAATFTNNEADGGGGAIQASELDASGVTASGNTAGGSGGGAIGVSGDALVSQCRIVDNSVDSQAGPARGGGLLVTGSLALRDTEVSGNRGRSIVRLGTFGTAPSVFAGGGVSAGNLSAERVTIAKNEVFSIAVAHPALPGGPSGGGGVHASGVSLVNVTISDNLVNEAPPSSGTATFAPNQGAAVLGQSITLEHVTIADNRGAASLRASQLTSHRSVLVAASGRSACEASVTVLAATYNHFSDASCALNGTGNEQSDAPFLLGPVADNGGAVPTRLPAYASLLVDAVPPAACPVTEDARGVARPRGVGCDIGAVELQPLSGTGSADLSVAFTVPPASVTPGDAATWQLTIQNQGPNAAAPAVRIAVPDGITLTSASATEGGACTVSNPAECVFGRALPPGGTAQITLVAQIDASASAPVTWSAEVFARDLRPPFHDDRAELTTPLAPRSGIRMTAGPP
ncbi:MAG TPA: choice-of-anchor Q domain-containing protein [Polyangiaceae bacterium]